MNWYIRVISRVDERLRKLGKFRIMSKLHGILPQFPVSPLPKENFVNASKRLLENRNLTFPVVRFSHEN